LFNFGLRAEHKLLEFGCGSLRVGRFLIQYLDKENYYGIEPNKKLLDSGIQANYLNELIEHKKPQFHISDDCNMPAFGIEFDFILAYSVFTHLPVSQIKKSLKSANLAMNEKSIFLATYFEGKEDNKLLDYSPRGIHYRPEFMFSMIEEASLNSIRLNLNHFLGQTWLLIRRS